MSVARFNRLSVALATAAPVDWPAGRTVPGRWSATERLIERARAVKDASEIATLREAGRRLARVAARVPALVREGRTEIEVAADIDAPAPGGRVRASGVRDDRGVRAQQRASARPARARAALAAEEGVVLDFGGVYDGYCVDLTRTVELGTASPEWRRLAAAVAEAQRGGDCGGPAGRSGQRGRRRGRDVLAGTGWARRSATAPGTASASKSTRSRGSPGRSGQTGRVLEPGMVFTIEPGRLRGGRRRRPDRRRRAGDGDGCEVLTRG